MADRKLGDVRRTWEEFDRRDALWAIASVPTKRGNRWSPEEFMAPGAREVDEFMGYLASLGVLPARERALDFGCGVGRPTQATCDDLACFSNETFDFVYSEITLQHNPAPLLVRGHESKNELGRQ